jgi:hypothetical protein
MNAIDRVKLIEMTTLPRRAPEALCDRLGRSPTIDADRIALAIEFTRLPPKSRANLVPRRRDKPPKLVQAAELVRSELPAESQRVVFRS